jgi:tRNA (cytidine/uridine-2'-O-)-methyltransferase
MPIEAAHSAAASTVATPGMGGCEIGVRLYNSRMPAGDCLDLPPHRIELAVVHPQIAPNTGNIARLCVATGTRLHLVRPMGFVLDDRQLRRSAMDYWPRLQLTVHDSFAAFLSHIAGRRAWWLDSSGKSGLFSADFQDGDFVILGNETHGLPMADLPAGARVCRIPQVQSERCINLATAAGIVLYQAIGQGVLRRPEFL